MPQALAVMVERIQILTLKKTEAVLLPVKRMLLLITG